jgi:hypothetical protein
MGGRYTSLAHRVFLKWQNLVYVLRAGWESSGVPGLVQRAALDFLWGGGWQDFVLEQGPGGNATAGNATAGGAPGLSLKGVAFPQNRALNARFAGVCCAFSCILQSGHRPHCGAVLLDSALQHTVKHP